MATRFVKKISNDRLTDLFQSQNSFFLEDSQLPPTSVLGNFYNIFGFELPHILYLGKSKLLKECAFRFLGSERATPKSRRVVERRQSLG